MTDEEAIRIAMQGKIIRCCADCVFFEKHKCQLGYNKESNPLDRFFDDCGLEDIEKHDAEVRTEVIDKLKEKCDGNKADCVLCVFAISDDDSIGCYLDTVKEQKE